MVKLRTSFRPNCDSEMVEGGWSCGPDGELEKSLMNKTHNLIFVNHPSGQDRRDFEEIGARIEALAPQIAIYIVPHDADKDACGLPPDMWTRPTFCVSFQFPEKFNPERGAYYVGRPINKAVQIRRYIDASVPTPETVAYQFGRPLDPSFWGDYVIINQANARRSDVIRRRRLSDAHGPGSRDRQPHFSAKSSGAFGAGSDPEIYRYRALCGKLPGSDPVWRASVLHEISSACALLSRTPVMTY